MEGLCNKILELDNRILSVIVTDRSNGNVLAARATLTVCMIWSKIIRLIQESKLKPRVKSENFILKWHVDSEAEENVLSHSRLCSVENVEP